MEMMAKKKKKRNRSVCLLSMKYPTYSSLDYGSCLCTTSPRTENLHLFHVREIDPCM